MTPRRSGGSKPRVFLSYGRDDAQELAELLRTSLSGDFTVWHDKRSIKNATLWDESVERGIREASAVLYLLTPHSARVARSAKDKKDSGSRDELAYAVTHNIPIVPVRVLPADTPLVVHRLQQIDFERWDQSRAAFVAGVTRIIETLEGVVKGDPVPERQWTGIPTPLNFEPLIREKLTRFTGRQWLFAEIHRWLKTDAGSALLIVGDPGSGKSAVAAACVRNDDEGRVLAYHFCEDATPETTNPAAFVRSIAGQLSASVTGYEAMLGSPEIVRAIGKAEEDPASAFEHAVLGPLGNLPAPKGKSRKGRRYILIDALDEALSHKRPTIVDVLSTRLDRLPPWLTIVATTRRDPPVTEKLEGLQAFAVDAQAPKNRDDVRLFIEDQLKDPVIRPQLKRSRDAAEKTAKRLLDASEGNFLASVTALDAVRRKLITLDEAEKLAPGLGSRYQVYFRRMFPEPATDYKDARQVLAVVVAAQEPLSRAELSAVVAFKDDDRLATVLRTLSSFVRGETGRFRIHHKTMGSWLTEETSGLPIAGEYFVGAARGHEALADYCWAQYKKDPASCSDYCVRHLATHLASLGRAAELGALLTDLRWLGVKLERTDVSALVADCKLAGTEASRRVSVCVTAAAAAVQPFIPALAQQLLARLPDEEIPELLALREQAGKALRPGELHSRFPTMTLTGLLMTLDKSPNDLSELMLSDDGRWIYGRSGDGQQACWDANLGQRVDGRPPVAFPKQRKKRRDEDRWHHVSQLGGRDDLVAVQPNADRSKVIALWSDGMIGALDMSRPDWIRMTKGHHFQSDMLQFLGDDRFATHIQVYKNKTPMGETKIWDFETLGCLGGWHGHSDWVRTIAVSADGQRAASVSIDRTLKVWDLRSGRIRQSIDVTTSSAGAVAVSPDGKRILTGDRQHQLTLLREDGSIQAWRPKRPADAGPSYSQTDSVYCINAAAFMQDSRRAIIGADGLYEVDVDDAVRHLVVHPQHDFNAAHPDGQALASPFQDNSVEIYALAIAPDESVVAAGGGSLWTDTARDKVLRVWDMKTRKLLFPLIGHMGGVTSVAMAGVGELHTVSADQDGAVISWDLEKRKPIHVMQGHAGTVRGVAISPDGRYVVSAGTDRTLRTWNLRSGKEISRLHGDAGFSACAFGPDGRLVVGDMVGHVHFFEAL